MSAGLRPPPVAAAASLRGRRFASVPPLAASHSVRSVSRAVKVGPPLHSPLLFRPLARCELLVYDARGRGDQMGTPISSSCSRLLLSRVAEFCCNLCAILVTFCCPPESACLIPNKMLKENITEWKSCTYNIPCDWQHGRLLNLFGL